MLNNIETRIAKSLKLINKYKKNELFIETNANLMKIELSEFFDKVQAEFPEINI